MNEVSILGTILPIFAVIALGYLAVRSGYIARAAIPHMGRFVISICLPALVFSAVASSPVRDIINPMYVLAYTIGGVLSLLAGLLFSRCFAKQTVTNSSLNGIGMSLSNSAFVGAPVLLAIYGDLPVNAFTMNVMVENVVALPLFLIFLEIGRNAGTADSRWVLVRKVGGNLASNPIIIGLVAGIAVNLAGLTLPATVERSFDFLVNAAAGVALFVIGGSLVGIALRGNGWTIAGVTAGKLIVHPVLVLLVIWVLPDFDSELQRIAILSAAMPMLSIYPALAGQYRDPSTYAAILMVSTLASVVTLSVWLSILY